MSFSITSIAFAQGQEISDKYTCDGSDISTPLSWKNQPEGTQSLVLIMDDPDAPDPEAPKMTWVHWLLYNLPADSSGLPEAVSNNQLPAGTLQGTNNWGRTGYGGPCPPIGRHRYFFKLYALDSTLPDLRNPDKECLLQSIKGHVLEEVELMGTYQHHD
jgi:Raf kinase inhibitor-like YbhB/YbcL family protein